MLKIIEYPKISALLAGALLPLAFAPTTLFPLGFLAPMVLYLLWESTSPQQAFRDGYLFGLSFFGVGVSWIFISIHDMGHVPVGLAGFVTVLFIAFLALFPALQGYLTARFLLGNHPIHAVLTFPASWVVFEAFRGWVFTGFPWLYLGYSQMDSPLRGFSPIVGVLGISFATLVSGGLLLLLWRTQRWSTRIIWALPLCLLWGGGAALGNIRWTIPSGEAFRVSLLQVAIPQKIRWSPEERMGTIRRYMELTKKHWGSHLIIWPENALTIFYHQANSFLTELTKEAQKHDANLLIGLPVVDPDGYRAGNYSVYYNALVGLPGEIFYFKHHLVPFAEFLPFKKLLGPWIKFFQVPMSNFSHGPTQQKPLFFAGHRLGLSICYEAAFPREIATVLPEAELLINVSNDGWFGNSLAPYQNLQMTQMRALEMGRWLLRSTNTGISAIIGPNGKIYSQTSLFQDATLTTNVQPMIGMTPYIYLGDAPVWALVVLSLAAGRTMTHKHSRNSYSSRQHGTVIPENGKLSSGTRIL